MPKEKKTEPIDGVVIKPQRSATGQWLPGHVPTGDFHAMVARKRRAILEATSEADALDVMDALRSEAMHGNVAAATVWLAYAVGKPESSADPKNTAQQFDAINLARPASELTADQRRARLAFLLAEKANETK